VFHSFRRLMERTLYTRLPADWTLGLGDVLYYLILRSRVWVGRFVSAIRCGLHRQNEALMTCFTPSVTQADHVHIMDSAGGGYASAASALKGADQPRLDPTTRYLRNLKML
jgi:hypothetical protein